VKPERFDLVWLYNPKRGLDDSSGPSGQEHVHRLLLSRLSIFQKKGNLVREESHLYFGAITFDGSFDPIRVQ
jgi:hypothetical protein